MTRVIDITVPLSDRTLVYPGDPPFSRTVTATMRDGASYNSSAIAMSAHLGTHVDAPFHFTMDGARIDEIPPERWVTDALVVDAGDAVMIGVDIVGTLPLEPGLSVLFHTRNSDALAQRRFLQEFCCLTLDAAELLLRRGVGLVGIDYLSIERYDDPDFPVHKRLLSGGVLILENLALHDVPPGRYTLVAAPLLLEGSDGAPVRAFLLPA